MSFLNQLSDGKKMTDKVFKAAVRAKNAKTKFGTDQVFDATLGTLFKEDETLCTFDAVWTPFKALDNVQMAKYAGGIPGNPNYLTAVSKWLFNDLDINHKVVGTPGGAGAVSATIKNVLNPGETLLKPNLGWGPYNTMAAEFGINTMDYNLFEDDHFNLSDITAKMQQLMDAQGRVLVIINDPCHNPSGYTMKPEEWDGLLSFTNRLSEQGPVVILHDIAYVDFSTNPTWKEHFKKYTDLPNNVMVVIAFSLSKSFTAYGMRAGAAIAVTKNNDELDKWFDAMVFTARSTWSTVNNSIMTLFETISGDEALYNTYKKERQYYIDLLKERASIFIEEAKDVGLKHYPFTEGFFVTLIINNEDIPTIYQRLEDNNIFTVQVNNGLRVALCSVSRNKLKGLAKKIKNCM